MDFHLSGGRQNPEAGAGKLVCFPQARVEQLGSSDVKTTERVEESFQFHAVDPALQPEVKLQ